MAVSRTNSVDEATHLQNVHSLQKARRKLIDCMVYKNAAYEISGRRRTTSGILAAVWPVARAHLPAAEEVWVTPAGSVPCPVPGPGGSDAGASLLCSPFA